MKAKPKRLPGSTMADRQNAQALARAELELRKREQDLSEKKIMMSEMRAKLVANNLALALVFTGAMGAGVAILDDRTDKLRTDKVIELAEAANRQGIPYRADMGENEQSFERLAVQRPAAGSENAEDDCYVDFDDYRKTVLDLRDFDKMPTSVSAAGLGFAVDGAVPELVTTAHTDDDAVVFVEKLELLAFQGYVMVLSSPAAALAGQDSEVTALVKKNEDIASLVGEVYETYCL